MKKILILCEGPNELKVVNLLLDHGKLKFSRDDLLDMRPFHARQLASPQLKPALDAYHGELEIYRIGDKMSDALKIPKELSSEIKTQKKFCTLRFHIHIHHQRFHNPNLIMFHILSSYLSFRSIPSRSCSVSSCGISPSAISFSR